MSKILSGLKAYFMDWKNWLTHGLIGVILLLIALFAPVPIYVRVIFIIAVIGFNLIRMKYFS